MLASICACICMTVSLACVCVCVIVCAIHRRSTKDSAKKTRRPIDRAPNALLFNQNFDERHASALVHSSPSFLSPSFVTDKALRMASISVLTFLSIPTRSRAATTSPTLKRWGEGGWLRSSKVPICFFFAGCYSNTHTTRRGAGGQNKKSPSPLSTPNFPNRLKIIYFCCFHLTNFRNCPVASDIQNKKNLSLLCLRQIALTASK